MSTPSERINLIRKIAESLADEDDPVIDLTLRQFGLPTDDEWDYKGVSYVIEMTTDASTDTLRELAKHLGYGDPFDQAKIDSDVWTYGCFRLFASHLSSEAAYTANLKDSLSSYNISTFVAHMDITPTREWENEIQRALGTADALVALLHTNFHQSAWTDQEVGFVLGRERLAVAVRLGEAPYGFIGRLQAFSGIAKSTDDLAREIFQVFIKNKNTKKRMAEALIHRFTRSDNYKSAARNMELLKQLDYADAEVRFQLEDAARKNSQIARAFGMTEKISESVEGTQAPTVAMPLEDLLEDIPFE